MASTAFNTQGATPILPTISPFLSPSSGGTSQGRALTNMSVGGTQTTTPSAPQITMPQPPSQPVTSHTVTDAAGNTTKQTYDTTPGLLSSTNTTPVVGGTGSGGTANPNFDYTNTSYNTGAGTPVAPSTATTPTTSTTNAGTTSTPQTQQGFLSQIQNLINSQNSQQQNLTGQEQQLSTNFANMNAGILNQPGEIGYQTGRQAQLQQTENTGLAALEGQQAQLAAYEQPQLSALTTAAGQLSPQNQSITPPAGGVTTIANTGQQYSNPILSAPGQTFYSAQPQGTPGQPSTAGQTSQYTVQSGDSLSSIAAANGMTTAQLEAANPGITNPNLIQPGQQVTIPSSNGSSQYGTGPAATANVQSIEGFQTQASNMNVALNSITANMPGMLTAMQQGNINPAGLNIVNGALQAVGANTSNPYYQEFINYANDFANKYAIAITPAGQDPTNARLQIAQSLIDGTQNAAALQQVMNNLTEQGKTNLGVINNQITALGGNPGSANATPTGSSGSTLTAWPGWNP